MILPPMTSALHGSCAVRQPYPKVRRRSGAPASARSRHAPRPLLEAPRPQNAAIPRRPNSDSNYAKPRNYLPLCADLPRRADTQSS